MFHLRDGIYFEGHTDGSVTIRVNATADARAPRYREVTVPANEWASVVASVSRRGETYDTWNQAQLFHLEPA